MSFLRRQGRILVLVLLIVLVAITAFWLWQTNHSLATGNQPLSRFIQDDFPSLGPNNKTTSAQVAPKVASILDGTLVDPSVAKRHPLGVMIENHPDARPQFGLSSASVVYEAIAEGGITRFLAIFGPGDAKKVGPIRSARTYYVDWCDEFDCYYSHVGGNYDALYDKIPADKVKDIDEFRYDSAYYRDYSRKVATEHTMFSSTDKLRQLAESIKWPTALRDNYNIYSFSDPATALSSSTPEKPIISPITIDFSTPEFRVQYDYDLSSKSYKRTMAGAPHIDADNGKQISPSNVIVQYISRSPVVTQINEQGWAMPTVGSGKAEIYQGGLKIIGTWTKSDKNSRTEFFDDQGKLIKLFPGQTWVEVVNPGSTVLAR